MGISSFVRQLSGGSRVILGRSIEVGVGYLECEVK